MPVEILMPKLGLTMTEGMIVSWKKRVGEAVSMGEVLFVLETEKVTYEVEATAEGVLGAILVAEKETVPVGARVGVLLGPGETQEALGAFAPPGVVPGEAPRAEPPPAVFGPPVTEVAGRPRSAPRAKAMARALGIDLGKVRGTGPQGMILGEDVATAKRTAPLPGETHGAGAVLPGAGQRLVPAHGMRRAIAKKMLASKTEAAQTYMTLTADATKVLALREAVLPGILRRFGVKVTITDIMMKIAAEAVRRHPILNTRWTEAGILYDEAVHMGMAMALDDGLIVPVIRNILDKDLGEVARERVALIARGRSRSFLPDDIKGSTITLSAMGMFGIEQFTANINLPESAILAVGAIVEKPVAVEGRVVIRPRVTVTLSYDHRTIDGAEAGKFMGTLKALIEDPSFLRKIRVLVIGGGVAGYPAAITAARLGAEVTLVERGPLGGVCLNRGCIPTKSLLQSCEVLATLHEAGTFGIRAENVSVDFTGLMARKTLVVEQLRAGVEKLLAARKIRVIRGTGRLLDRSTVQVLETGETLEADRILLATGSRPVKLPLEGAEGPRVWDSDAFLSMEGLPGRAVIIGGGVVGVEFAQILQRLGSRVTLLERLPDLLPGTDVEIARALEVCLAKEGVRILKSVNVRGIRHTPEEAVVLFEQGGITQEVPADAVVMAAGRRPDPGPLDAERLGLLQRSDGAILVDARMETSVPGIYAAGDLVGGMMLAHVGTAEGECAARNALGEDVRMDYGAVPSCVYTSPEVACVGLTEEEAKRDHGISVARFPFHGTGKALVLGRTYGMVKIVAEKGSGRVLGVHIIGPHATDLIAEAVLGMSLGVSTAQIARAIHPHPTLSEAVAESAMALCGGALHLP